MTTSLGLMALISEIRDSYSKNSDTVARMVSPSERPYFQVLKVLGLRFYDVSPPFRNQPPSQGRLVFIWIEI